MEKWKKKNTQTQCSPRPSRFFPPWPSASQALQCLSSASVADTSASEVEMGRFSPCSHILAAKVLGMWLANTSNNVCSILTSKNGDLPWPTYLSYQQSSDDLLCFLFPDWGCIHGNWQLIHGAMGRFCFMMFDHITWVLTHAPVSKNESRPVKTSKIQIAPIK